MTAPEVVTLTGDRRALALVAATALDAVEPVASPEWLGRLDLMLRRRREALRELRHAGLGPRTREVLATGEQYGVAGVSWWVALSVGAVLTFVGAVAVARLAPEVLALGALILLVLAVLPVPGVVREGPDALVTAAIPGLAVLLLLLYNASRVDALRAAARDDLGLWFAGGGVAVVAAAALALRAREVEPLHHLHWRRSARQALAQARWLRGNAPPVGVLHPTVRSRWEQGLAALAPDLDEEVIARAREMGPWVFLIAAYYDGEIEVPAVKRTDWRRT